MKISTFRSLKTISQVVNNRRLPRHFVRRLISQCLIVVLLSTQTFATPQLAVVYADMVTGWKQEARLFYYAQGWGSLLMAFWQGKLSDKPTKPDEKTQENKVIAMRKWSSFKLLRAAILC